MTDLLDVFNQGFNFILNHLKLFYDEKDHNIGFMTLYQQPMVNGLPSGPFDIQDNSVQLVDRILAMLYIYLTSHQSLQLDKSFKVYLKILSIPHMKFKAANPRLKVSRKNVRKK